MSVNTVERLFLEELKDLFSAEHQLTQALPRMITAAESAELKSTLENHLEETEAQIGRLETIFRTLGAEPEEKRCEGVRGALSEGAQLYCETPEGELRDAAIISTAQRVEHYEIAGYGVARTLADVLGHSQIAQLLQESLSEEKSADMVLTDVSRAVNASAVLHASA